MDIYLTFNESEKEVLAQSNAVIKNRSYNFYPTLNTADIKIAIIDLMNKICVYFYVQFYNHSFFSLFYRLFIGLWCLLLGGLMQIFIQSTTLELVISIGGALLFCLFIVFDTQLIMHTLSPEEYILATINIYLDIINLFLHILRALAVSRQ